MKFTVPGRPVPAVRMTQRSKFCDKQALRYLEYKDRVKLFAIVSGVKPKEGEVLLSMTFFFKNKKLPDIDNLVKAIMDGLNGIAYQDDRQVGTLWVRRKFAEDERAEIEIV